VAEKCTDDKKRGGGGSFCKTNTDLEEGFAYVKISC
jgi:hypothetical protein